MDPSRKTDLYREVFDAVGSEYVYSGAWSSGTTELYLVSSANDNEAYHVGTDQQFSVVLKHPVAGWELRSDGTGWKASDVSSGAAIAELESLVSLYESTGGRAIEPGDYTVVFGPTALADLLQMAIYTGFHGRLYEEKRAWTSDKGPGEAVLGDNITLVDDPTNGLTFTHGFDLGGVRRKPYPLLEKGRISGLMYDLSTSAKFGKKPTGHELRSPSFVMRCGSGPESPLKAVGDRGSAVILSIPALHYMNIPNTSQGSFTASSRFNATLIESGRTVAPLLSSRITDTLPRLFSNVSLVSPTCVSVNVSNTYERRAPVALSVPSYIVAEEVRITDCADSF
jgi:predicted Zn-dependent protease